IPVDPLIFLAPLIVIFLHHLSLLALLLLALIGGVLRPLLDGSPSLGPELISVVAATGMLYKLRYYFFDRTLFTVVVLTSGFLFTVYVFDGISSGRLMEFLTAIPSTILFSVGYGVVWILPLSKWCLRRGRRAKMGWISRALN
ncbi:MAG: hypothetical protein KDK40_03255, partial [Chlamydiia bacterium]|nr:hypothetical protein [Chlamydiia bacterium]